MLIFGKCKQNFFFATEQLKKDEEIIKTFQWLDINFPKKIGLTECVVTIVTENVEILN